MTHWSTLGSKARRGSESRIGAPGRLPAPPRIARSISPAGPPTSTPTNIAVNSAGRHTWPQRHECRGETAGQARHAVISAASAESAAAGIRRGSSCTARSYRTLLDPRVPPRRLAPRHRLGRPSGCSRGLGYNRATRAGDGATQGGHDPPVGRSRNLRPPDQGTHSDMTVETSTWATKKGLAQMLKGGVIMDVVTPDHAKIAEDAGAVAVMALERVPSDIRATGGVARMSDPAMIEGIMAAVSIPVMAKARIGHFVEAQILEALGVDYIDESEVLTPADEANHIDKHAFKVPFVCGCRDLGEALRRISEGAAMIRTKGEAGTGNIVEAVRHIRTVNAELRRLASMREDARAGALPVVNFVAGGIATPADAALAMQLGADGVFVGSGIFKSEEPARMANAIVQATTHFDNPKILAEVSKGLGAAMRGIALEAIPDAERLATRGW